MTKNQIKLLRTTDLQKLSTKWLLLICRKQFGKVSLRAQKILATERNVQIQL